MAAMGTTVITDEDAGGELDEVVRGAQSDE
jgi:hypothetical protein